MMRIKTSLSKEQCYVRINNLADYYKDVEFKKTSDNSFNLTFNGCAMTFNGSIYIMREDETIVEGKLESNFKKTAFGCFVIVFPVVSLIYSLFFPGIIPKIKNFFIMFLALSIVYFFHSFWSKMVSHLASDKAKREQVCNLLESCLMGKIIDYT